ncbi:hypothetical protein IGI04_003096 [Brassica rapa subsp. trilocularis]|uniref:DUF4283 domain-containing protein n=1 Tax=Brassica rapa subsp. trilocularis TaxID=1813537 RepID=A0ABQ7P0T2_BRACM|nr:hypothetical protein IGI04_003096 [Brassica rapa subsp. trilocularis]
MTNDWKLPTTASAANPPPFSAGEPPTPALPPDPPDPTSPLSPHEFPPLSSTKTGSSTISKKKGSVNLLTHQTGARVEHLPTTPSTTGLVLAPEGSKTGQSETANTVHGYETQKFTIQKPSPVDKENSAPNLIALPPKSTSPLLSNIASSFPNPSNHIKSSHSNPPTPAPAVETLSSNTPTTAASAPAVPAAPSLVERLRSAEDKSLERLAPVTLSAIGRPRILIPDSVFEEGAQLHKDFIICYYNGRALPFNQIQSVFNHMWSKGKKLEIHNNPLNRSTIVRIPNAYLRQKILEKNIWYVGDSMFHTAQWTSKHSKATPSLQAIKIWAHLTGVPLDLRHKKGLSLVAGLVGDPKETDDFTKNLVSLSESHVKVEVDLTRPLPSIVEFERQSGEVVEVLIQYPWTPPKCSHCNELGHVIRNCLHYVPPLPQTPASNKEVGKSLKNPKPFASKPSSSKPQPVYRKKTTDPTPPPSSSATTDLSLSIIPPPPTPPHQNLSDHPVAMITDTSVPIPPASPSTSLIISQKSFSSPDQVPRPSLKPSPFKRHFVYF